MEKRIEHLSKLADDIVLSEQDEKALFREYKMRMQAQRKKRSILRKSYRATAALVMIVIVFCVYFLRSSELEVYASTGNNMVRLDVNEKIYLEKQKTPLEFDGYVFEISVKKGKRYYTIEDGGNLNPDNIFRNGAEFYWIPDGINSDNFTDGNGNRIVIQETDSSTLNLEVCNDDGNVIERVTLVLENKGEQCSVELLRND